MLYSRKIAANELRMGITWVTSVLLVSSCSAEQLNLRSQLYPEAHQPRFKTCLARNGGTYHERALQRHGFVDFTAEPASDEGLITDESIVRG